MATKIIIKNSSVPDKEPDAGALERGELAVNLVDRKLYTKDANDEVFSFGSAGEVPSGGSGDRPTSPNVGDLFYDTDLGHLLFWNGTDWEQLTSETPGSGTDYVKLDDGGTKQVIQSGGLGISDGTTENITLNASGSATFAGNVTSGNATTSGAGATIYSAGIFEVRRDGLPVAVFAAYKDGSASTDRTIELRNDGIATFAGRINCGDIDNDDGVRIYNTGALVIRQDSDGRAFRVVKGDPADTSSDRITFKQDGSAEFSSTVTAPTFKGNLDGNASTATNATNAARADSADKLTTARSIALSGDASGSANFDGSANITISTSVSNATNSTNATNATNATNTTNVNINTDNGSNATRYVTFSNSQSGNQRVSTDNTLYFNPSQNRLYAPIIRATTRFDLESLSALQP